MEDSSLVVNIEDLLPILNLNNSFSLLSPSEQNELLTKIQEQIYNDPTEPHDILQDIFEYRVHKALTMYIPPVLIFVGLCGNFISLFILLSKSMIRQTTNVFFAALAVVDSIVLCAGLLRIWIGNITNVHIEGESTILCKIVSIVTFSSSQLSSWLIIAVTILRYIAVRSPHKAVRYCNRRLTNRIIIILAVVIISINLHFAWTVQIQDYGYGKSKIASCDASSGFIFFIHSVWPWIDTVLSVFAPFILIASFNALIVKHIVRATNLRRSSLSSSNATRTGTRRSDIKITLTLLTVSFSFLLSTLPMAVIMLLQNKWLDDVNDQSVTMQDIARRRMIRTIAEMLMYLDHSIHFFLYCAVGQNFRNQLSRTLCKESGVLEKSSSNHNIHLLCSRHNGGKRHMYGRRTSAFSTSL